MDAGGLVALSLPVMLRVKGRECYHIPTAARILDTTRSVSLANVNRGREENNTAPE